ncbi:MAG: ATP synthase subunit I [Pseudomonadota bacterium]|nr:ATP synthase subunit I [Pseudomonadota bacterium]
MSHFLQSILIPLAAGGLIGFLYFLGLWRTVRRLPFAPRPWRLLAGSYLLRLVFALGGFYLLMDGSWERPVAAVAGFVIVRSAMTKSLGATSSPPRKGAIAWKS